MGWRHRNVKEPGAFRPLEVLHFSQLFRVRHYYNIFDAISTFGLFFGRSSGISELFPKPDIQCMGSLVNFSSILSPAFRASTVFVGIAVLFSILCVVAMLLFCVMKDQSVFEICSIFQALQGKSMHCYYK